MTQMRDSTMHSILFVYGTRPEAVKVAPLIHEMETHPTLTPLACVSGQHREMLDQVNEFFNITPSHDLQIMSPGQTPTDVVARTMLGLRDVLRDVQPDGVVVQGDTSTAVAGALAAFYHDVPVIHLEAGLRTGFSKSPFPEEMNRRTIGVLADLHLAPTQTNADNLRREGVSDSKIVVSGNTVIDALMATSRRVTEPAHPKLREVQSRQGRVLLVTIHRRESWGSPLTRIFRALRTLAQRHSDMLVLFPVHQNPQVHDAAHRILSGVSNIILLPPLDYQDFVWCLQRSHIVLTDSGGIQEEAPSLGKPVLVARDDSERPEAIKAGVARLVGTEEGTIVNEVTRIWEDDEAYATMSRAINPYGDGQASRRCVDAILQLVAAEAAHAPHS